MTVNNFSKSSLRNYAYLEFMQTVVDRLTASASAISNPKVNAAIVDFKSKVAAMDAAYKVASKSALTEPLAEADTARDRAYGTLSAVASAMQTSGIQTLVPAATEILNVLKTFRVNTAAQYNEESGAIIQLCQELDNHSAALATLNLSAVYAELKAKNALVRTLGMQRNEEQATDPVAVMKTHRAIVDAAFDNLRAHLDALLILDSSAALEKFVAVVNKDIYRIRINTGQGASASASAKDDNDVVSGGGDEVNDPDPEGGEGGEGGNDNPTPTPTPGGGGLTDD